MKPPVHRLRRQRNRWPLLFFVSSILLLAPLLPKAKADFQPTIAARAAIKLSVKEEGFYRATQVELIAAGLDSAVDPRNLQMFVDGREQAIIVTGEADGRFDSSDAVEFYGVGIDSAATDLRTYWLVAGSQPGRRIEKIKSKGSRSVSASFPYTVERRDRTIYLSSLKNGEKENFFGAVISKEPVEQVLILNRIDAASQEGATLELALQGVTGPAHRVKVELNGVEIGFVSFAGKDQGIARYQLKQGAVKEGENIIKLTGLGLSGDVADVSAVDYIRITYPRAYWAEDDALRFTLSKKQRVTIDGFTSESIRVFDVTDVESVIELRARVDCPYEIHNVTLSAPNLEGRRALAAIGESRIRRPVKITANRPSDLRDPSLEADLVIIAHRDLIDSVAPLVELRRSEALAVKVVDIEDVFDEFSFGNRSPHAIRDFLQFTKTRWAKPPRYVLLAGDASLDPKNYLGRGDNDFVPTKMIDTSLMETASDDWLADGDGDGLADIAIGRLPARTAEEASRMISKIAAYNVRRDGGVLLVADNDGETEFQESSDEMRRLVPGDVTVEKVSRDSSDDGATMMRLIHFINRGQRIVNYQGRGQLLASEDALRLANRPNYSIFFAMTCLNGYFADAALDALAESLLKADSGGAVAVWASTGMCDAKPQAQLNIEMFRLIFSSGDEPLAIGEAALKAKRAVSDTDVRLTYVLLGDPAMRLR